MSSSANAGFIVMDWVKAMRVHANTIYDEIRHSEDIIATYQGMAADITNFLTEFKVQQERATAELTSKAEENVQQYNMDNLKDHMTTQSNCDYLASQVEIMKNECVKNLVTDYSANEGYKRMSGNGAAVLGQSENESDSEYLSKMANFYSKGGETFTNEDLKELKKNPSLFMGTEDAVSKKEKALVELIKDDKADFVNRDGVVPTDIEGKDAYFNDYIAITETGFINMFDKHKTMNPDEVVTSISSIELMIPDYKINTNRRVDMENNNAAVNDMKGIAFVNAARIPMYNIVDDKISADHENVKSRSATHTYNSEKALGILSDGGVALIDEIVEINTNTADQDYKVLADMLRFKLYSDYQALEDSIIKQYILTMKLAARLNNY